MRRVLLILLAGGIVIAAAWQLASLTGDAEITVGELTFEAPVSVFALAVAAVFIALHLLLRLLGGTISIPRKLRAWRARRDRTAGDLAVTRALVSLAAGEAEAARREAARARARLGDTPQTLLLAAEAGRLAGRQNETENALRLLSERPDGAFLGLRGLLREAMAQQNWAEAARLAAAAERAHPGAAWLKAERAQLAIRTGAWSEALSLAAPDAPRATLATAAATAEATSNPDAALRHARMAFETDPTLAPAALAYAQALHTAGKHTRAQDVLRKAWIAAPHPDLAAAYLAHVPEVLARMQAAERLTSGNPDHPESRLLLAQTALAAELLGEARRHAEGAQAAGLADRRLFTLLADIEEADRGDTEAGRAAQRDALRAAAAAPPGPEWHCEACGMPQARWVPLCPHCSATGKLRWSSTQSTLGTAIQLPT